MQRSIFSLLFVIAGGLLFQSAQAQTLVDANGTTEFAPTGTHNVNADTATAVSILYAHNGGTITGQMENLTLNVSGNGSQEYRALNALGTNSLINMTAGQTVIDMRFINPTPSAHYRGAIADSGGTVNLKNVTIFLGPGPPIAPSPNRGVEATEPGSKLSATDTTINMKGDDDIGAFAFHGGTLSLTNCTVTLTGSNGFGIASQTRTDRAVTTLSATDTMISVTGNTNDIVAAYFRGATTTLDRCTIDASGSNNNPLVAYFGGVVNVTNSTVTSLGSNAALVDSGSVLNVVGSTVSGGVNGIVIFDEVHTLGPDTVTLTNSKLTNAGGNGEAAFRVVGADVNIAVTDSTVDSGVGATQHTLLDVTQTVLFRAPKTPENVTPAVTQTENQGQVIGR